MKFMILIVMLCLVGCIESENIASCSRSCKNSNGKMLKYNQADGCVCQYDK